MIADRTAAVTRRASAHLDMLRGLSAIVVLIGHIRGMFFVDLQALGSDRASLGVKAAYGVTSLGYEAVMVFFVLSGFFIGGSVLNSRAQWTWRPYLVNRLTRLYVVLVPALVLTALVDYAAQGLPGGPQYYGQAIAHFNAEPYANRIGAATFFGNLLFLQNIVVSPFGSNSPLWSLANEAWYYLMFPLAVVALASRTGRGQRLTCSVLLASCVLWLPIDLTAAFAIWLMGAGLHWLPSLDASRRPGTARLIAAAAGVSLAAVLALVKLHRFPSGAGDYAVGLCAAGVIYSIVKIHWTPARPSAGYARVSAVLSRCSFSVYAVHFPLVMLLRVSVPEGKWMPTPLNAVSAAAMAAGVFAIGFLFSRLTEARTDSVRRRVTALVAPPKPAPVALAQP